MTSEWRKGVASVVRFARIVQRKSSGSGPAGGDGVAQRHLRGWSGGGGRCCSRMFDAAFPSGNGAKSNSFFVPFRDNLPAIKAQSQEGLCYAA